MRYVFILVFGLGSQLLHAQQELLDSLLSKLNDHQQQDSIRISLLNQLSIRILKIQPEKSLLYAEESLSLSQKIGLQTGVAEAKNNLAAYYLLKGKPDYALKSALESSRIAEQENNISLKASCYATLGTIYHNQGNLNKAQSYLRSARTLNLKSNNVLTSSKILNALGGIARDKKEYDSALIYYQQALTVMRLGHDLFRLPEIINNIGNIYVRLNNNALAMNYYQQSMVEAKANDNPRAQSLALVNMGGVWLASKNYKEAESALLQSLKLSNDLGDQKILSQCYMLLGQIKNETGKFNEAHLYLSKFFKLKDSLQNIERIKKIAELEIQYETEKKERTIQLLEKDKALQSLQIKIFLGLLFVIIIGSISVYQFQRFKQAKNLRLLNLELDKLSTQNRELSMKFKDMLSGSPSSSQTSVDNLLLKNAVEVINEKIGDPSFSVDQMAKEMGMSRTNMHRKIKAITGFPPSELIRNIRMRKAASLLLDKSNSISEVSYAVGFEDHSYFTKSFKKAFGVVPSDYFDSVQKLRKAPSASV